MNEEENYKILEKVMQDWANTKNFSSKGLFFQKNTVEHVNLLHLKTLNMKIDDKDNVFLVLK